MLDGGAAGLHAIKSCGGAALVQHPLDASSDEMPPADLAGAAVAGTHDPSDALRLEVEIAAGRRLDSSELTRIADPTALSCPHCHGVLSEMRGARPLRFRCQIGHGYTAETLAAQNTGQVDEAIRIAMRLTEERVTLVERMA